MGGDSQPTVLAVCGPLCNHFKAALFVFVCPTSSKTTNKPSTVSIDTHAVIWSRFELSCTSSASPCSQAVTTSQRVFSAVTTVLFFFFFRTVKLFQSDRHIWFWKGSNLTYAAERLGHDIYLNHYFIYLFIYYIFCKWWIIKKSLSRNDYFKTVKSQFNESDRLINTHLFN